MFAYGSTRPAEIRRALRLACIFLRQERKALVFVAFFEKFVYTVTTMRIWAKVIIDGRIKKQYVYERAEQVTYSKMFEYLAEICSALDVPTPVLVKAHIFNFAKFNHVKFTASDFVESISFDQLFIENLF